MWLRNQAHAVGFANINDTQTLPHFQAARRAIVQCIAAKVKPYVRHTKTSLKLTGSFCAVFGFGRKEWRIATREEIKQLSDVIELQRELLEHSFAFANIGLFAVVMDCMAITRRSAVHINSLELTAIGEGWHKIASLPRVPCVELASCVTLLVRLT